jgi:GH24 family phage-related lysozyme (muramidase)
MPFNPIVFGTKHIWEMTVAEDGLFVVKRWELFMASPYLDSNGMWAIGYGHTNAMGTDPHVEPGMAPITELQAHNILVNDMATVGKTLRRWIKVPVTNYMYTAIASLCLNAGLGNFKAGPIQHFDENKKPVRGNSILESLNKEDYTEAAIRFLGHNNAKFEVMDEKTGEKRYEIRPQRGLTLRRCAEITLFMTKKE